jgi:hypothetical protein
MITQILWLLSWPVLIIVSYYAIVWALKKFDNKLTD